MKDGWPTIWRVHPNSSAIKKLATFTFPVVDDLHGGSEIFARLRVLSVVGVGHAQLVAGLSQQAIVGIQVLFLDTQAFLEITHGLLVVLCKRKYGEKIQNCQGREKMATSAFKPCQMLT